VSLQMRAPHRRALSKSLAALWKRSDDSTPKEDEPVPGFDIASNSNDREVARAEVKVETAGRDARDGGGQALFQRAQAEVHGVGRHRALRLHQRKRPLDDRRRALEHRRQGMVAQGPPERRAETGAVRGRAHPRYHT
jgi:hypothetical protein